MRKIAGYLTKNRSGKDQKIAQSTHENEYIKPRKTFWRNSKQFLILLLTFSEAQKSGQRPETLCPLGGRKKQDGTQGPACSTVVTFYPFVTVTVIASLVL